MRQLSPAKRKSLAVALAAACVELVLAAHALLRLGKAESAGALIALALTLIHIRLSLDE